MLNRFPALQTTPPADGWTIGLDVGGTKIAAIAADRDMQIGGQALLPTNLSSNQGTIESIIAAIKMAVEDAGIKSGELQSIGIGIPGLVNHGVVEIAVNLNLQSFALADLLENHFEVPVFIENDVRTAALGVYDQICQQENLSSLAYLSIGTGISAGLILNGRLYRGANGMAGEIGHVVMTDDGDLCNCGLYGCLETFAAGPALAAAAYLARKHGELSSMDALSVIDGESVFAASRQGDLVAKRIVERGVHYLSRAIHWLVMGYDVEKVVLGGGVSSQGEFFLEQIQEALQEMRSQSPLAARLLSAEKIVLLPPDTKPAGWGAVVLARQMVSTFAAQRGG